jgi:hypothetical protein
VAPWEIGNSDFRNEGGASMKTIVLSAIFALTATSVLSAQAPPEEILEGAFIRSGLLVSKREGDPLLYVKGEGGPDPSASLREFASLIRENMGAVTEAEFKTRGVTVKWRANHTVGVDRHQILIATSMGDSSVLAETFEERTSVYAFAGRSSDATARTGVLGGPGFGPGAYGIALAGDGVFGGNENGGEASSSGRRGSRSRGGNGKGNGFGGRADAAFATGAEFSEAIGGDGGSTGGSGGDAKSEVDPPGVVATTGPVLVIGGNGFGGFARGGHAIAINSDGPAEAHGGSGGPAAPGGNGTADSIGTALASGGNCGLGGMELFGPTGGNATASSVKLLAEAHAGNGGFGFFGGPGGRAFAESARAGAAAFGGRGGDGVFAGAGGNGIADAATGTSAFGQGGPGGNSDFANGRGGDGGRGYAAGTAGATAIGGKGGDAPNGTGSGGVGGPVMARAAGGISTIPGEGGDGFFPGDDGIIVIPFVYPPPAGW